MQNPVNDSGPSLLFPSNLDSSGKWPDVVDLSDFEPFFHVCITHITSDDDNDTLSCIFGSASCSWYSRQGVGMGNFV